MQDLYNLQKGNAKLRKDERVHKTISPTDGKRKVQINSTTWVYTNKPIPDEEVISNFHMLHQLAPIEKWK